MQVRQLINTYEQQFHYGVFYAYMRLREQEIRNIMCAAVLYHATLCGVMLCCAALYNLRLWRSGIMPPCAHALLL